MKGCNVYESDLVSEIMGETLRPGGFQLTDLGVAFCNLTMEDSVLDLGCGRGATVNYLFTRHHIEAFGIDSSFKLIKAAREDYNYFGFFLGRGEDLPFPDESFHCVFAECTLSLMDDLNQTIDQVGRVLKNEGWFVITDVYARNPETAYLLNDLEGNSCMRGLHDVSELKEQLEKTGFQIELFEDYSDFLKELLVKIGFQYGSMSAFWTTASGECADGDKFQETLKLCRPGYFMMIARKGGGTHE